MQRESVVTVISEIKQVLQRHLADSSSDSEELLTDKPALAFSSKAYNLSEEFKALNKGSQIKYGASLDNLLFRIFISKEMLEEVVEGRKIFGADFGKPFRCKAIDILGWDLDWKKRGGWVEPHNAIIHMIYRAGIVGLVFMILVWSIFIRLSLFFIKIRDVKGILLSAILLYWLVISNFAVILGLPYFAIPFWCLFGMTYKYFSERRVILISNGKRVST